jgi:hypothetical protein
MMDQHLLSGRTSAGSTRTSKAEMIGFLRWLSALYSKHNDGRDPHYKSALGVHNAHNVRYLFAERKRTKPMKRSASLDHRNVTSNRLHTHATKWREQEFSIRIWLIRMCAQALQVTVCVSTRRK